jgi:hypothetical protein
MKFKSEFGLGEICEYNEGARRGTKALPDILVKVVAITFDIDGQCNYMVEHIGCAFGVQRFMAAKSMLTNDPAFDQNLGCYPKE